MGYTVCTISGLVIEMGAPVRAVFLANMEKSATQNAPVYNPGSWYTPVSAPIKASFDDFARVEGMESTECSEFFMKEYFPDKDLDNVALWASKQGLEILSPNHTMRKNNEPSKLSIAYINEDVYQSILNMTHEGKARNFEKETAKQFEVLKGLCSEYKNQILRMDIMKSQGLSLLFKMSGTDTQNDEYVRQVASFFETAGGDYTHMAQTQQKEALLDALINGDEEKAKSMFTDLMALHHIHGMMHVLNRTWQPANAVVEEKFTQAHVVFNESVAKIARGRGKWQIQPRGNQPKP